MQSPNNYYYLKCIFQYVNGLLENEDFVDEFLISHELKIDQKFLESKEIPVKFNDDLDKQSEYKSVQEANEIDKMLEHLSLNKNE